jgi:glycosyltransferase involved in cell wall biosynthesis
MDVHHTGLLGALLAIHAKMVAPRLLRSASAVLVSSLDYARASSLDTGRLRRIVELPYAIDTLRYSPGEASREQLAPLGIAPDDRFALFVGAMDRAHSFKGVRELLHAFVAAGLERTRLVLVGDGDMRPEYERESQRLGLDRQVVFAGRVPEDALVALYRAADVLVLPSTSGDEAFGVVLIEAMACGSPVIASRLPGVRSVVDEETGVLVPPGDVNALAAELKALVADPDRRSRMASAALERARSRFSRDRERDDLRRVFEGLSTR